jgi:hypothetical protein
VIDTIARSADLGAPQTVLRDEDEVPSGTDDALRPALELGRRVGRYLAAVGADDAPRAAALWPELHAALVDLAKTQGNPRQRKDLRALADNGVSAAERILNAYTRSGELIDALRAPPVVEPKYTGQPDDVVAQAELLFRQRRHLNIETLHKFHLSQGGARTRPTSSPRSSPRDGPSTAKPGMSCSPKTPISPASTSGPNTTAPKRARNKVTLSPGRRSTVCSPRSTPSSSTT